MGTVHSLAVAAASPERLRRRFDLVLPGLESNRTQPVPQSLIFGSLFFLPFSAAGQVADELLREMTLFSLACAQQQLRFFFPSL